MPSNYARYWDTLGEDTCFRSNSQSWASELPMKPLKTLNITGAHHGKHELGQGLMHQAGMPVSIISPSQMIAIFRNGWESLPCSLRFMGAGIVFFLFSIIFLEPGP